MTTASSPSYRLKKVQFVAILQSEGMKATVSSIHINGWFGGHNKLVGAHWAVEQMSGRVLYAETNNWAFIGDSTNDQLIFEAFPNSLGVANVTRFKSQLVHFPRYVTDGERGAGFAKVVQTILKAQSIKTL